MQYMHHDLQRSQPLLYVHEYTVPHSDASATRIRHYVGACVNLAHGIRPLQHYWSRAPVWEGVVTCGHHVVVGLLPTPTRTSAYIRDERV